MKGLQLHITLLAGKDEKRFEEEMLYWARNAKKYYPNSIRFFDKTSLTVGETTLVDGEKNIYRVKTSRLYVEYICISKNMCILRKVIRTDGKKEETIYEIHDNWEGSNLWYSQF